MLESMIKAIQDFLAENPLSPRTIDCYRVYLSYFSDFLEETELDPRLVTGMQIKRWYEKRQWSDNTRRIAHCAIRAFLRYTYGDDHPALKSRVRKVDPGPQRTLSDQQIQQLLDSLSEETPEGVRNRAMILLMLDSGLRANEVCRLRLSNLDLETYSFKVKIKGGGWGDGVYSLVTAFWLDKWLGIRQAIAKPGVQTVFVAVKGITPGRSLTRDGLRSVFRRMGKKADLGLISPHDLRRSFATLSILRGAPTRLVQVAGRWKHIREVERYTRALTALDFAPYMPSNILGKEVLSEKL